MSAVDDFIRTQSPAFEWQGITEWRWLVLELAKAIKEDSQV